MLVAALSDRGVSIDLAYVARHFLGRSYPVVMQTIRQDFGLDLPPGFEEDYRERLLDGFRQNLQIMPGVRAVLDRLAVPFCVAPRPRRAGADVADPCRAVGDRSKSDIHRLGSDPRQARADLFLHAAARMGADPARCLVIEDSLTGLQAGRAAGMTVWRFTGGSHMGPDTPEEPPEARPHARFASFAEFFQIAPDLERQP